MTNPFSRISLLWKIMLSTSVAITLLFAVTGWLAVKAATRATTQSINHEVQASFQAYQSLWKARADRLSSISSILSAMSDVRAAFRTEDVATIRDVAGELWSRVSDAGAFFVVANPRGGVIASSGGTFEGVVAQRFAGCERGLFSLPGTGVGVLGSRRKTLSPHNHPRLRPDHRRNGAAERAGGRLRR